MSLKILPLPVYRDNYVWILYHEPTRAAWLVDPGDAQPVLDWLQSEQYRLEGILVTHRHWDHINGINELLQQHHCPVFGPASGIDQVNRPLTEGDSVLLFAELTLKVIHTPGHTREHLSYFGELAGQPLLFCGDTLFAAGCGRLLDGTAPELKSSLDRLRQLPQNTRIYCTHEYTQANLKFAAAVEKDNAAINKRLQVVEKLRDMGQATLPSQLADEHLTNPFLRCDQPTVIAAAEQRAGTTLNNELAVFTELRRWKDNF